ncbi:DUF4123 domain-containing protein [Burkholderia stagnalis]|uniref:DUF4123 domain-containing protein n=1 Tax=Burkholderia stagnalis TaxID=1503054 RepID=UPI000754A6CE|nr:DUF4123 domain-containing protein [Burkholderia stagnalis]KVC55404.1 hypothetical protein WS59_29730 [Burkholderia stagnalis]KVN16082.1 hypothetical protein WT10_22290 [Burkholderia stagnalis]KWI66975.1 hypothetical protein WT75_25195 [Burkholderia stagnalis]KWK62320.1 hypothetical protein WT82_25545 [Burkholderia stagnalis]KWN21690.1 hypothetical protein WT84_12225 [Burkholderia stagnalis]
MSHAETKLYGLLDGARYPEALGPFVLEFASEVRSLFDGLPEEEAGYAAPFLVQIDDASADWVKQIDTMDQFNPCMTLIRSKHEIDGLCAHLRCFLIADIGDDMTALVRYFDPRVLPALLDVWDRRVLALLTSPMETWLYRGHASEWIKVNVEGLKGFSSPEPIAITLSAEQIDELERRCDLDAVVETLTDLGEMDADTPYADRYGALEPMYRRALRWGLANTRDRMTFCSFCLRYGSAFDQQSHVKDVIEMAVRESCPLEDLLQTLPQYVWERLSRRNEVRGATADTEAGT